MVHCHRGSGARAYCMHAGVLSQYSDAGVLVLITRARRGQATVTSLLVDSATASAGALDPQTSPVKAIVRRTRSVVQRRHAVLNLGP